jgi:D-methionine transport system substrate-binding protein
MSKKLTLLTITVLVIFSMVLFVGCGGNQEAAKAEKTSIKVGVTAGPHAEILDEVKKVAEKDGLKVEIVEFNDYVQPNMALNQGEIDLNSYQHQPFLDEQVKDRGYKIESIAKTVIFPIGIYSQKVKVLADVKDGAIVSVPNDPTNGGRALLLLQKVGLIKLKPNVGLNATAADIAENPKNLQIKELEAAQVPLSLKDVDIAVINTNFAIVAGLVPTKDSLAIEDANSPYANIIVAQTKDKDNPAYKKFVKAYQSDEVKNFINEHFKGSAIAAW